MVTQKTRSGQKRASGPEGGRSSKLPNCLTDGKPRARSLEAQLGNPQKHTIVGSLLTPIEDHLVVEDKHTIGDAIFTPRETRELMDDFLSKLTQAKVLVKKDGKKVEMALHELGTTSHGDLPGFKVGIIEMDKSTTIKVNDEKPIILNVGETQKVGDYEIKLISMKGGI